MDGWPSPDRREVVKLTTYEAIIIALTLSSVIVNGLALVVHIVKETRKK